MNITGLTFPLAVRDVPRFESLNPNISVNVLCEGDGEGYVTLYITKERNRPHHVNLFLLEAPTTRVMISGITSGSKTCRDSLPVEHHPQIKPTSVICAYTRSTIRRRSTTAYPSASAISLNAFATPTIKVPKSPLCNSETHGLSFAYLSIWSATLNHSFPRQTTTMMSMPSRQISL